MWSAGRRAGTGAVVGIAETLQGRVRPDDRRSAGPGRGAPLAARSRVRQPAERDGSRYVRARPRARRLWPFHARRRGQTGDRPSARVVQGVRDRDEESETGKDQLLPNVATVPDGIGEIVARQKEGWGYIKAVAH